MAQRQLNVRLDEKTFSVLEAAAFVEGTSLPDVIRPQLEALAERFSREHAVETALRAREEHRASQAGKLSSLKSRQLQAKDADR
jgi:hypothetical protein